MTPTTRSTRGDGQVRLACFDLDNTLIDRQAAFCSWARSFVRSLGLGQRAIELLAELDRDGFASREEVFGPAREQLGLAPSVEELIARYRQEYPAHVGPAPDSAAALTRLRRAGFLLALVTNGPPTQQEKLDRSGLAGCFDAVCISELVGITKPDPEIFREAVRRCGRTLEEVRGRGWMVGDSPSTDVGGGRAAGLRTCWIRRERAWELDWYRPDAEVDSVPEAVELILAGDS